MKFVETGPCNDDDAVAAVIFDNLSTNRPHDYGLLGTTSLGPLVQLDQTAADDSSQASTQCWQKFGTKITDPFQTLTCSSPVCSLLSYTNPLFPPTPSLRGKRAAARRGGHDNEASKDYIENAHLHKLVERQRRSRMKALCSTLLSVLPDEYRKRKCTLSDKLLEVIKHIRQLQNKLIELEKQRDLLNLSVTVKPFPNSSCIYKNLQASQARPSNVRDKFQTVRVSKFGLGIQVAVNTFKNQIAFSCLLNLLEEAGVEVVSATVTAINDRVFYSIHSKLLDLRYFDAAVLQGRIDQLMNDNLPKVSVTK
nr:bHLH07 [Pinus massoniana]